MICSSVGSAGGWAISMATPAASGAAAATAFSIRSRTVVRRAAALLQAQPEHTRLVEAQVLDVARVRAELGQHLLDGPPDPGAGVERVQVVQQQQALHQRVGDQLRRMQLAARPRRTISMILASPAP